MVLQLYEACRAMIDRVGDGVELAELLTRGDDALRFVEECLLPAWCELVLIRVSLA